MPDLRLFVDLRVLYVSSWPEATCSIPWAALGPREMDPPRPLTYGGWMLPIDGRPRRAEMWLIVLGRS